jgi:hypothetical protein
VPVRKHRVCQIDGHRLDLTEEAAQGKDQTGETTETATDRILRVSSTVRYYLSIVIHLMYITGDDHCGPLSAG